MKVGDLVQISVEAIMSGESQDTVEGSGVIIRDQSPMRPPQSGRLVNVLWDDGQIEEHHSNDLAVISEIELSDAQLEHVCGGMTLDQFDIWRCGIINEDR